MALLFGQLGFNSPDGCNEKKEHHSIAKYVVPITLLYVDVHRQVDANGAVKLLITAGSMDDVVVGTLRSITGLYIEPTVMAIFTAGSNWHCSLSIIKPAMKLLITTVL